IQTPRMHEFAGGPARATPYAENLAILAHAHQAVIAVIANHQRIIREHYQIIRKTKLSGAISKAAECPQKIPVGGVMANSVVAGVRDPEHPCAVECQALRPRGTPL